MFGLTVILQSYDQRNEYYELDTADMTITNPCSSADVSAVKSIASSDNIRFYPNPASDILNIQYIPAACEVILLYDMQGRVSGIIPTKDRTELPINTSVLAPGVYTAVARGENYQQVAKVVVAR